MWYFNIDIITIHVQYRRQKLVYKKQLWKEKSSIN